MASTLKLTDIQHPSSGTPAITIGSDNAVAIGGGNISPQTGFRNRIINGAMTIDQRNAGASVTPTTDNTYALDRWSAGLTQASKFSVQRSAVAPSGFTNSALITSLSAYSLGAGDAFLISQNIEGFNVADLGWGTASAQAVTLSFWVRSSLTGTFGGVVANSAANRSYPFSYTISSANTWEQKTITVLGDTTGTWLTSNEIGMRVRFSLGAGSNFSGTAGAWAGSTLFSVTGATSVVGTSGATFYLSGVQLEKGSVATPFEFRSIGQELGLCYRYCFAETNQSSTFRWFAHGFTTGTTSANFGRPLPVPMRATPTGTVVNPTGFAIDKFGGVSVLTGLVISGFSTATFARLEATSTGLTGGVPCALASDGTASLRAIIYTAEL
jgi:hypothetical protein